MLSISRLRITGEPDRVRDRVDQGGEDVEAAGLGRDDVAPLGGDGGQLHRRHRRGALHGADKDGRPLPLGASRQVQPGKKQGKPKPKQSEQKTRASV